MLALDEATANVDRGTGGFMQLHSVHHHIMQVECELCGGDRFMAGEVVRLISAQLG